MSNTILAICPIITTLFVMIIFSIVIYSQLTTLYYNPVDCYIQNVSYPTIQFDANTSSIIEINGFISCDCGNKCTSDYGICIKIFGYIYDKNITKMLQYRTIKDIDNTCTFREEDCDENINNRLSSVENARLKALSYLNKNTTCYTKDNDNYYLNNDINMEALIVASILCGLILLLCLIIIIKSFILAKLQKKITPDNNIIHTETSIDYNPEYKYI